MSPDVTQRIVSRRRFLSSALTALGGAALAACGAGTTPAGGGETGAAATGAAGAGAATTPAAASGGASSAVQLTAWFWDDSFKPVAEQFNKNQNKIQVKFEKLSYDDTHKKLLTSFAAGSGAPDVVAIEIGMVAAFVGRGGLVDLLQPPYDVSQYKNDLVAYQWAQGMSPDGKLRCMPWAIGPAGLMYREDVFKEAGLETDAAKLQERIKTWDDWFKLGEDLRKKLPNTALVADAFTDIFTPMIEQKGHGWFTQEGKLDYQKGQQPLQRAVDARARGVDAKIDWWGAEYYTGLKKKAVAGLMGPCWMQGVLHQNVPEFDGKWRAIRAPEGDYNVGGSFWAIPEQTKNKEAAWEFLKYVCLNAEGQNINFKTQGAVPAYKPAWKDPMYDQPIDFFGGQKAYRLWADIGDQVPPLPVNPEDRMANDIINAEITKVKKEGKDPTKAIQDATEEAKKRIKELAT
jgi:multiple sugar transport system substrate-binding protein